MAEESIARVEQMEKNQQKLQEILAKDRDEHREKMAQMMQVIMRLSQEKRVVEGLVQHPTSYAMLKMGTFHCPIPPMVNAISESCFPSSTPILSGEVYTLSLHASSDGAKPTNCTSRSEFGDACHSIFAYSKFRKTKGTRKKEIGIHDAIKNTETQ